MPNADLVLEGGGMKGLGLVGAVLRLLDAGYRFPRVAGTSAGSILAAFVAAGLSASELGEVMDRFDYGRVPDRGSPGLPGVSESLSLLQGGGAYEGDYTRTFLHDELRRRGVATFGDLRREDPGADPNLAPYQRYRLVVMVTDITRGRLLRLPWDYRLLGLDPDQQPVADAVRASMSIPFYFDPVVVTHGRTGEQLTLVDGGVLSNFPLEVFDRTDGRAPRWPTFGVKILPGLPAGARQLDPDLALVAAPLLRVPLVRLAGQVITTAIVGNDQTYLQRPCVARRAIQVDARAVGLVQFHASPQQRAALTAAGDRAARAFLAGWDWEGYRRECRGAEADRSG